MQKDLRPLSQAEISRVSGGSGDRVLSVAVFAIECVVGGGTYSTSPAPYNRPTCTTPVKK